MSSGSYINVNDFNSNCLCKRGAIETQYDSFFADTQIFLSPEVVKNIKDSIFVLEKIIRNEKFKKTVFKDAYTEIENKVIEGGVLMSYDFHIADSIPKLINKY
jgi:hypothetical protein